MTRLEAIQKRVEAGRKKRRIHGHYDICYLLEQLELRDKAVKGAIEALEKAKPWIGENMPNACGACGQPNAQCDSDCLANASCGDALWRVDQLLSRLRAIGEEK